MLRVNQTTLNRIRQSGSASVEEQKKLEDEIHVGALESSRNEHRTEAQRSHEDYVALTRRCKDEMVKIKALEEKPDKSEVEGMCSWHAATAIYFYFRREVDS